MFDNIAQSTPSGSVAVIWAAAACVALYVLLPSRRVRIGLATLSLLLIAAALLMQVGALKGFDSAEAPPAAERLFITLCTLAMLLAVMMGARYRDDRAVKDHALARTDGAVAIFDLKGKLQYVNNGFLRLFGLSTSKDAVGRDAQEFFSDRDDGDRALQEVLAAGNWHGETNALSPDGSFKEAEVGMSLATDPEGAPSAIIGSFVDVGPERSAQGELRLNQSLLATVAEVAPLILWAGDTDGKIKFATGLGLDVLRDQITDQSAAAAFCAGNSLFETFGDAPDAKVQLGRAQRGHASDFRYGIGRLTLETHIGPQLDAKGRIAGIVGVTYVGDKSSTQQPEMQGSSSEEAEQTQPMAAIGRLTGGIAHDFNNVLTTMLGNLDLILEQAKPESETHRFASAAAQAAERGTQLTQRLLSYGFRQPLNPCDTDVSALVTEVSTRLSDDLPASMSIELDLDDKPAVAFVDDAQLETAIANLVQNARDAMPNGGTITIATGTNANPTTAKEPGGAATELVSITVSDTGSGMAPDTLAHACEPFFTTKQTSGYTGIKGQGLGLGLSTAYGFACQSNGSINIDSAPGQGTAVTLYLPAGEQPKQVDKFDQNSCRVMVVEDDPDVRDFIVCVLERMGHSVIWAEDGDEALEVAARNHSIDLLISDVVLPGKMTGPEVVDCLLQSFPDTKVLFTSGYIGDDVRVRGRLEQDVELLAKPYTIQALTDKVRTVLQPAVH